MLVVRVPADPSRHRVAVWRELRRAGAVSLGQGVWVVPDAPVFADGIARTVELAERGDGEVTVLTAVGRAEADVARLEALFTAERAEEWAEFIAECAKFDAEIDKEIRIGKFTLAELEEEEQSLERLRRWHRELIRTRRVRRTRARPRRASSSSTAPNGWPTTPSGCSPPCTRCDAVAATHWRTSSCYPTLTRGGFR